jgi:two-component system, NarL family, nitrate/nitrite response regulator NarL
MRTRQSFATILIGKSVLLREGLSRILRAANIRIHASASCADDLIPSSHQRYQPLFLIVHAGDDFNSTVEQIELVRAQYPNGRIAIVADHCRPADLVLAFQAGANGYLVDLMTCDAFVKSIELVVMGQMIFPPALLSFVRDTGSGPHGEAEPRHENVPSILLKNEYTTVEDAAAPQLSRREQSILCCLKEGDSNKRIARKIDIAETTVKVHVKAILRKIRVQNRTQAAIWALNNGSSTRSADKGPPPEIAEVDTPLASSNCVIGEGPAQLRIVRALP